MLRSENPVLHPILTAFFFHPPACMRNWHRLRAGGYIRGEPLSDLNPLNDYRVFSWVKELESLLEGRDKARLNNQGYKSGCDMEPYDAANELMHRIWAASGGFSQLALLLASSWGGCLHAIKDITVDLFSVFWKIVLQLCS